MSACLPACMSLALSVSHYICAPSLSHTVSTILSFSICLSLSLSVWLSPSLSLYLSPIPPSFGFYHFVILRLSVCMSGSHSLCRCSSVCLSLSLFVTRMFLSLSLVHFSVSLSASETLSVCHPVCLSKYKYVWRFFVSFMTCAVSRFPVQNVCVVYSSVIIRTA